ncbi:hypothetical protein MD535_06070 [Vibrio sp. ZSDZ65]|uniref:Uncharacterized protein n=1 Tax=Vibrio qingdaonensis TaxID=2829491 RepID=A0A9X3HVQ6_9VIBR|nr:hypothetical protein [Vibrio qingdaonensis]MCW8345576.1 hypothetical protein [Vibrio qingdaonensis]
MDYLTKTPASWMNPLHIQKERDKSMPLKSDINPTAIPTNNPLYNSNSGQSPAPTFTP